MLSCLGKGVKISLTHCLKASSTIKLEHTHMFQEKEADMAAMKWSIPSALVSCSVLHAHSHGNNCIALTH